MALFTTSLSRTPYISAIAPWAIVAASTFNLGCLGRCEEQGTRQFVMIDANTNAGVCGVVKILDGDDVVQTIEVNAVLNGTTTCTGLMDFERPDEGTYLFRIEAPGYETLERGVELARRGGCDSVGDAAFEGEELRGEPALYFKLTPRP